jgi:hypothetical protein
MDITPRHRIPVRHVVLHASRDTLRERIECDAVMGISSFRQAAGQIAEAVSR